jgi:ring-1,2-phenylacetyl-CoA epoxidase subunit PaaB
MRRFEVFLKKAGKEEFRHAGALDAPDGDLALLLARECYCRRGEGDEMWLVDRDDVLVADEASLAVNHDKSHRHNDGAMVAARRKQHRADTGVER